MLPSSPRVLSIAARTARAVQSARQRFVELDALLPAARESVALARRLREDARRLRDQLPERRQRKAAS